MAHRGANRLGISRRRLLTGASALGGTVLGGRLRTGLAAPGVVVSDRERPQIPCGVMSGDPTGGRAIIWSKTDRPARMLVEYATREDFRDAQRVAGPAALAVSDYTARVDLGQLSPGAQIFYRVTFQDLADLKTSSAPAVGSLRTPGDGKRTITFAYSGDEAGQGWGVPLFTAVVVDEATEKRKVAINQYIRGLAMSDSNKATLGLIAQQLKLTPDPEILKERNIIIIEIAKRVRDKESMDALSTLLRPITKKDF